MEQWPRFGLLGDNGRPLNARVEGVLKRLLPRLRRQFPTFQDEVSQIEILEEAGRRILKRERRSGPLERINGYAWVAVRSVAMSRMRRSSSRLLQRTVASEAGEAVLSVARTPVGGPEQIERHVLLREVLGLLSPGERRICIWKQAGFSSRDIARHRGSSAAAVDTLFSRAKQKIRKALGVQQSAEAHSEPIAETRATITARRSRDGRRTEAADGERRPAP